MKLQVPQKLVKRRMFGLLWVLIFSFLLSWFFYFVIFAKIYEIKKHQKLTFYFEINTPLSGKPESLLNLYHNETLKENGLLDVSYYSFALEDEGKPQLEGVVDDSDFILLAEERFVQEDITISDYFLKVDDLITVPNKYIMGHNGYSIKIYDSADNNYNSQLKYPSWLDFNNETPKSYYLLVSNKTANFNHEKKHELGYLGLPLFLNDNIL